jgi:hypothetical protein
MAYKKLKSYIPQICERLADPEDLDRTGLLKDIEDAGINFSDIHA